MLLSVALRSPLPNPLSPPPPPTPAALQQAALQAALLARHRQLIAQARPARNASL